MSAQIRCSDVVRAAFRDVMRGVASTVTVVTACDARLCHGMTATSVTSVSMDPPSLLVCVNSNTLLHDILLATRRFCVNILRSSQADISAAFGGAVDARSRFGTGAWAYTGDGIAYLTDAQANVFCRKAALVPYGSHAVVIGEVETVDLRQAPSEPLIYQNARYCVSVAAPAAARSGRAGLLQRGS
jgi:flavin reductase (DIM6/NTAB) family NADH-FMN oxidoreductase RutF